LLPAAIEGIPEHHARHWHEASSGDPMRRAVETIGATISAAMSGNNGADIVPLKKSS